MAITVKEAIPKSMGSIWKFTRLDVNCISMTIKGQWIFNGTPDEILMRESLSRLLAYYPHLAGRVRDKRGIVMNNEGVAFHVTEMKNLKIEDVLNVKKPLDFFNAGLNISGFIKGDAAPLSVQLTRLADGSVLNVHCAHACLDGHGFYKMMSNWSRLYNNQPIEEPVLKIITPVFAHPYSKEEALRLMTEKRWRKVGFKDMLQLVRQKITKTFGIIFAPIFLPDDLIGTLSEKVEKENGRRPSRNAVLSALATKLCCYFNDFKEPETLSQGEGRRHRSELCR